MNESQQSATAKTLLFEPWGLGDALIAFATALARPDTLAIACQSRWLPLLTAVAEGGPSPELLPVDMGYVRRHKEKPLATSEHPVASRFSSVLSIRGDIRDFRAARRLFPNAQVRMSGWLPFLAKRFATADLPYAKGYLPVKSRYRAWAEMAGVPWQEIEDFYARKQAPAPGSPVCIHVGAQWRSKQYPDVQALADALRHRGPVEIVAGPGDPLPNGVIETGVNRRIDQALVATLRNSALVIANDSGPMHLAAMLRRPTLLVANLSAMTEWLPPGVVPVLASPHRGHRASHSRPSEDVLEGWPEVNTVLAAVERVAVATNVSSRRAILSPKD